MKTLRWIAWLTGAVAVVLIIMGSISIVFNVTLTGVGHIISYFHAANSFLLVTIALLLAEKK